MSFTIAGGERIGIVGPSGAGKSSILRLLLRQFLPQAGRITIAGQDVATLDAASIMAHVAIVAQDATLFHGSVANNLRLGRPEASQAELEAACRAANAHDFILALPGGYDALIGERGARLSGGQRQRIAIARALLRDAPILILDEALSAVDAENEALIQQALDRLMVGRTTLILAHRLSSVIGADRILVLDHGRVVESGSHAELMRLDGTYRRLMGAQAAEVNAMRADTLETPAAAAETVVEAAPPPADISAEAQAITWRETLQSLLRYIEPWHGALAFTVLCGIGRVVAFIGVGVLGALLIAALRDGQSTLGLAIALLIAAPAGGPAALAGKLARA